MDCGKKLLALDLLRHALFHFFLVVSQASHLDFLVALVFESVRHFAQFLLVFLYLPSQRVILFFVLRATTKCLESLSERFSARLVELVQQSVLVVAKLANVKIELLNLLLVLVGSHWLFVLPVDQKSVLVNPIRV